MNLRECYADVLADRGAEILKYKHGVTVPREKLRAKAGEIANGIRFMDLTFKNDLTNTTQTFALEDACRALLQPESTKIIALNGCVFNNQDAATNYGAKILEHMLNERKANKSQLKNYEEGSDSYVYYDLLQGVFKLVANSWYGITGAPRSFIYHPQIGPSVTYTGWNLIEHMIQIFEDFTDNPRHRNPWELTATIDLILSSNRTLPSYLHHPTVDELYRDIRSQCESGFDDPYHMVYSRIAGLSDDQRQRVWYAFNPMRFFEHSDTWQTILFSPQTPDLNVFDMSEDARNWYLCLVEDLMNACFYPRITTTRDIRADDGVSGPRSGYGYSMRKIIILSDTDSTFLNFGYWVHYFRSKLQITEHQIYHVIIPFMIYLYQEIARHGIDIFCHSLNIPNSYHGLISMKNEYVMSRVVLTHGKRNYITKIINREGHEVNKTDIKGLNFMKTSTSSDARKRIKNELVESMILESPDVKITEILTWLSGFTQDIEQSLINGQLNYATPKQVGEAARYKNPEQQGQVRGAVLWNLLYPDNPINPPAKCNVFELVPIYPDTVDTLQVSDDFKSKLRAAFDDWMLHRYGLTYISIPYSVTQIPPELILLIDRNKVVEAQLGNIKPIFRSLGLNIINSGHDISNQLIFQVDTTRINQG
jgi:hypothetical protein